MAIPRGHIVLAKRKLIASRMLSHIGLNGLEAEYATRDQSDRFDFVVNNLHDLTKSSEKESPDTQALDDYLRGVAQKMLALTDSRFGKGQADPLLKVVNSSVDSVKCERCAESAGCKVICTNGPHDDELVSFGGECIQPLKQMYEFARNECRQLYTTAATAALLAHVRFETDLTTSHCSGWPHSFGPCFAISGRTETNGQEILVGLTIWPESFDADSYYAVPYVFFHEHLCHVPQGQGVGAGVRCTTTPRDSFSEGWMDWIAYCALNRALAAQKADLGFGASENILRAARQFRDARKRKSETNRYWYLYQAGEDAAIRLWKTFRKLTSNRAALKAMFRLSCDMNLSRRSDGSLITFIGRVLERIPRQSYLETADYYRLIPAFQRYLRDADGEAFLASF
jgi:hypothetical protein